MTSRMTESNLSCASRAAAAEAWLLDMKRDSRAAAKEGFKDTRLKRPQNSQIHSSVPKAEGKQSWLACKTTISALYASLIVPRASAGALIAGSACKHSRAFLAEQVLRLHCFSDSAWNRLHMHTNSENSRDACHTE